MIKRNERANSKERHKQRDDCIICSAMSSSSCPLQSIFLLLLVLVVLPSFLANGVTAISSEPNRTGNKHVSTMKLQRIQRYLDRVNKPPTRSIRSPDGDVIDCIPQYKQPGLNHPLLKNHKIQRVGPKVPSFKGGRKARNYTAKETGRRAWQTWHHVGHCPKKTVPIRRNSVQDVLRAKTLFHYGKKQVKRSEKPLAKSSTVEAPDVVSGNGHEHAIAYTGNTQEVYGAKATINVWDPSIQSENEFSLSQVWILSGSFNGSDLNSIEAGWQVSPELYGDSSPRLFTYWTSDAYQATGCYNLLCEGFIQTNNRIAIGAAISPVSDFTGSQYDVTILIWKDPTLGNWWLSYGENMLVGYWPKELFTHLADKATMVEWGGEVVNMRSNRAHTSTQMGSGHFAGEGFGKASYFRNLEIVDSDNSLTAVQSISTLAENTNCYNIQSYQNQNWGTYFYYGGPGYNNLCR